MAKEISMDECLKTRSRPKPDIVIPKLFQVVVECRDEEEQRALFERLRREGFRCRVMVI